MSEGKFSKASDVRAYVWAEPTRARERNDVTLTLVSLKTGTRFTYELMVFTDRKRDAPHAFVRVLTGSNNVTDYTYLGTVFANGFRHGRKSTIAPDAPSSRAFSYFWETVMQRGELHELLEVWHDGTCSKCGMKLSTPESIARGMGPKCAAEE